MTDLPNSHESEQSLIGAMMLSPSILPLVELDDTDFYSNQHRVLYRAIREVEKTGQAPDAVTIGEYLAAHGLDEQSGGMNYAIELAKNTPSASNWKAYADIVRNKATLRRMIEAGQAIINDAFKANGADTAAVYLRSVDRISELSPRIGKEFPEPADLLTDVGAPKLAHNMMPPVIADYAFALADQTGVPADMFAHASLIACAGMIDSGFRLQPENYNEIWKETAILWGLVTGSSGVGKSTAEKFCFQPCKDINRELIDANNKNLATYQADLDVWKVVAKKRAKEEGMAAYTGMGLPESAEGDGMPQKPKQTRLLLNDFTLEKVSEIAADNPRGLIIVADELRSWFKSMDAYRNAGGKDRGLWLQYHNGGSMVFDRIGRGTTHVEYWGGCIWGGTQPDVLADFAASDGDDGMLQRFIPLYITDKPTLGKDQPMQRKPAIEYGTLLARLWATNANGGCTLRFSPEAYAMHREISAWSLDRADAGQLPPMMASWLLKWRGLFPRLCLVMHCIESAAHDVHPSQYPISGKTANRVRELMHTWMYGHADVFYSFLGSRVASGTQRMVRDIAGIILADGLQECVFRSIRDKCRAWREGSDSERQAAVKRLIETGWLIGVGPLKYQDTPSRAMVNPRVHVLYGALRCEELERRKRFAEAVEERRENTRRHRESLRQGNQET